MQWGQIKTIFIVSFLILNIFLFQQFINKINETNFESLAQQTTFEEKLAAEEITLGELPERGQKETYVSARRYEFSINDLEDIGEQIENQQMVLENNSEIIFSRFIEPLEIDLEENFDESLNKIKDQVLFGDEYMFWDHYINDNLLIFFQEQNGHAVYFNESSILAVLLNEEGDAIAYSQTRLTDVSSQSEEQTVIDPISAIEVLYNNNIFMLQDHVSSMKMGYHTLVPLDGGLQVFAPTWEVRVNGDRTYFVNAMEAQMIPHDEQKFINNIKDYMEKEIEQIIGSE